MISLLGCVHASKQSNYNLGFCDSYIPYPKYKEAASDFELAPHKIQLWIAANEEKYFNNCD